MAKASGPVLGLDIGSSFIKLVEITAKGSHRELTAVAVMSTPADAVIQGLIIDPPSMGQVLRHLVEVSGARSRRVISSVGGAQNVVVRIIDVPKMSDKELDETMRFEIDRFVPFAHGQEIERDYKVLPIPATNSEANMLVILAVAAQDVVSSHIAALQAAGLDPVAIEVEPIAAARSLTPMADDGMPAGETIGIINMGAGSTELTVVTGGILVFPRTISIGGDSFTKAIAENLGMRQDAAERHKRQHAVVDLDQMAAESAEPDFGGDSGMPDFSSPAGGPLPPSFEGVASGPGPGAMPATPGLNPFLYGGAGGVQAGPGGPDALGMAPPAEGEGGGGGSIFDLGAPGGDLSDLFSTQVGGGGPFGGGPGGPAIAGLGAGIGSSAGSGGAMTPEEEDAYNASQVRDCLVPVLGELVTEIRRSLDYYRSQHPELPISRLVLCGGTIRMPNLDRFLENELGVSVARANPLAQLAVNLPTAPPDWLQDVSPVLSVAIGLAERDMVEIPKDYVPRTLAQV